MANSQSIPKTMHAWRKHKEINVPIWEEVDIPILTPTGVLIEMLASGVCRSDLSLLRIEKQADWFQQKYTLGHEGCGRIIEIGPKVQDSKLQIGDVVALHAVPGCGATDCPECTRDLSQICERGHHSGIGQDGFYAPYAVVDVRGAVRVPEGISPLVAAVATDAVNTAFHAVTRRAEVKPEETVFLFGLGGLGFNALQVILHVGARVIVSEARQELLDEARQLGVPEEDLIPAGTSVQDFVTQNGLKIDTVLDFAGKHQTFEDAQHIVRRGGKIVCIGTLDVDNTVHMKIGIRKRLSWIFSYGAQVHDLEQVLQLIATGVISPRVQPRRLDELPAVLKDLEDGKVSGRIALVHE